MNILIVVKPTGENFIRHLYPALPTGYNIARSESEALQLIAARRPDVVLFEWANDLTANVVNCMQFHQLQEAQGFKTVVRIHDHEVSKEPRRALNINWQHVDAVWFINKKIQRLFHQYVSDRVFSFFLPNACDPAQFEVSEKKYKRAGLLSIYFRPRKGFERIVHLARACPDWEFHIRTEIPRAGEPFRAYFEEVHEMAQYVPNVHFEHREAVPMIMGGYDYSDLRNWYADKAVIVSASRHEGFHYAVAEGMLTGAMPIVWNWETATDFWQPFVVTSITEAAHALNEYERGKETIYRQYITDNFSPHNLFPRLAEQIRAIKTKVA